MFTLELPNTEADMLINAWLKNQVLLWPFEITKGQYTTIKCLHPENAFTTTEVSAIRKGIENIMFNTKAPYVYTRNRKSYRYFIDGRISTGDTKTIIPFVWSEQLEQYAYYLMMKATG
jgi:hypothetical protein